MKRLFLAILVWFWLTVAGVGVVIVLAFLRSGYGSRALIHFTLHDLMLFALAGGVFCYWISRYVTEPLKQLGQAAAAIADGRLETRVAPALTERRDEIADLARNFDRMAGRIESLVAAQRRLLGDVSHELRSPLSRLTVALGLLKVGPPEDAAENLERIAIEAGRLDALISQLLTLTRIGSAVDRGSPARVELLPLVQEVAADGEFEARACNRSVVIREPEECAVMGFEELLRSAVENVVRNAIRHTAEGTAVEISLQRVAGGARIVVRDHGPGVPEEMLAAIFEPFHRAAGSSGAGLGLTIAERAVTVHGGSIHARNATDGGLIVEIEIP